LSALLFGPLSLGDVTVNFKDRQRFAMFVPLQRPSARRDELAAVPPGLHEFSFPAPIAEKLGLYLPHGFWKLRLQERTGIISQRFGP
jgi:hypothetical protein